MTALRGFWTPILTFALCGCGARTDGGAASQRNTPVSGVQPAQPASTQSAPPQLSAAHPATQSPPDDLIHPAAPDSNCCFSVPSITPTVAPPPDASAPIAPQNEPARADAGTVPPPASNACFEYLGDWITCENAGWPNVEQTSAPDLQSCMQLCQQRADCTAVTDYFWLGLPGLGCWLYTSTCDAPAGGAWQEEDGGRQYRKTCATQ